MHYNMLRCRISSFPPFQSLCINPDQWLNKVFVDAALALDRFIMKHKAVQVFFCINEFQAVFADDNNGHA
jgi:hypothetical protein